MNIWEKYVSTVPAFADDRHSEEEGKHDFPVRDFYRARCLPVVMTIPARTFLRAWGEVKLSVRSPNLSRTRRATASANTWGPQQGVRRLHLPPESQSDGSDAFFSGESHTKSGKQVCACAHVCACFLHITHPRSMQGHGWNLSTGPSGQGQP